MFILQLFTLLSAVSFAQETEQLITQLSNNDTTQVQVRQVEETGDSSASVSIETTTTGPAQVSTSVSVSARSQGTASAQIKIQEVTGQAQTQITEQVITHQQNRDNIAAQQEVMLQKAEAMKERHEQKRAQLQQRLSDKLEQQRARFQ